MKFGVATDVVYWHEKLVAISREISAESGRKTCTKVFVTFETETSQRECLKAMTTGETTPARPSRKDTHCCVAGDTRWHTPFAARIFVGRATPSLVDR